MITVLLAPKDKGLSTVIDDEDADLADYSWRTSRVDKRHPHPYVRRGSSINLYRGSVNLHRLIMSRVIGRPLDKSEIVDHIDGNSLNNTRSNLRVCNQSQNNYNTGKQKRNTSGYKGVFKRRSRWISQIYVNRQAIYLGTFDTPELAHEAYKVALAKYAGEFGRAK